MERVGIIFTGGTISMKMDPRLQAAIPALTNQEVIDRAQGIESMADLVIHHFGNDPGPHMTPNSMFELSKQVQILLEDTSIKGVVVTHGTDTLEETAYLLDLVLEAKKPVAITGAMRNSSELGYDGPANLSAAICTVLSEDSIGRGVLVVMNNQVYGADEVTKSHTLSLDTFQSLDFGPLGIVDQDAVLYYRGHRDRTLIKPRDMDARVGLIKAVAGMDADILWYYLEQGYAGLVIEGMGRGNVPPNLVAGIQSAIGKNVPVVLVSRCPKGRVLDSYGYLGGGKGLRQAGVILGDNLSGPKARIKLMAILGMTKEMTTIQALFEKDLYKKV